jgi:hypothetical protein
MQPHNRLGVTPQPIHGGAQDEIDDGDGVHQVDTPKPGIATAARKGYGWQTLVKAALQAKHTLVARLSMPRGRLENARPVP